MPDNERLSQLLADLDRIANAPMTAAQRDARARPMLAGAGVSLEDITAALKQQNLRWNQDKAAEFGVPIDVWLRAINLMTPTALQSASSVLNAIHRAESAVAMLRSGYQGEVDRAGKLTWSH
jgi:hypothetical protein